MAELDTVPCPTCGRAVSLSDGVCPDDGTPVDSATAIAVASTIHPSTKAEADAGHESPERILGEVFGKYVVDRLIGRGGMGSVYSVTHTELGNKFALKIMDERIVGSTDAHTRFLREARAAARIDHPNVIRVLDHARHSKFGSYLVMELLSGVPLDKVLAKEKQLDELRAIDLSIQICDALGAAHEQGIIHRDLKPANVFLTQVRGEETVKVMDFGVAKVAADAATLLTRPGSVIGTPLYMSPEQWDNADIDARSDVYSFGVVLYEMLTGRLPIVGSGITEVAKNLAIKKPPLPRTIRPDLSVGVETVVMRCLEKKPEDRFASMQLVAEALGDVRADQARWTRSDPRRRRRSSVGVTVALLALAGVVAYGTLRWRASSMPAVAPVERAASPVAPPSTANPVATGAASALVATGAASALVATGAASAPSPESPGADPARARPEADGGVRAASGVPSALPSPLVGTSPTTPPGAAPSVRPASASPIAGPRPPAAGRPKPAATKDELFGD